MYNRTFIRTHIYKLFIRRNEASSFIKSKKKKKIKTRKNLSLRTLRGGENVCNTDRENERHA